MKTAEYCSIFVVFVLLFSTEGIQSKHLDTFLLNDIKRADRADVDAETDNSAQMLGVIDNLLRNSRVKKRELSVDTLDTEALDKVARMSHRRRKRSCWWLSACQSSHSSDSATKGRGKKQR